MRNIRVASVQFEHAAGDKEANFKKIRHFVREAAAQHVEIVAFPECCITGYWFLRKLTRDELVALAEPVPDGPSTRALLALAKAHQHDHRRGTGRDRSGRLLHNTYVVAMPDGEWRRHRKIHAFESDAHRAGVRVHGVRHPARLPRRRPDLLRLQHQRERAHHRADGRRHSPGAAPDRRLHLEEPAPDGPHRAPRLGGAAQRPRMPSRPS